MGVRATSGRWLSRLSRMTEAVQCGPKSWRAERSSWKKALREVGVGAVVPGVAAGAGGEGEFAEA